MRKGATCIPDQNKQYKLKNEKNPDLIKKIYINPDLTPLEQRKRKALRQQLADLNKDSNNTYIIKNGSIVWKRTSLRTDNYASNEYGHSSDQPHTPMISDNPLKITVVNCQSVQAKKCSFISLVLINQYIPDIIVVGTESWLTPASISSEIFPNDYNIYRPDHPNGYVGVFLHVRIIYSVKNYHSPLPVNW